MELTIHFLEGSSRRLRGHLEGLIREILPAHPFLRPPVVLPPGLTLNVSIRMDRITSTRTDRYPAQRTVDLNIYEPNLFTIEPGGGAFRPGEDDPTDKLRNLLLHEFGHFIDARLDSAFGYLDDRHPRDRTLNDIHLALWCSFIDGRLGELAPYDLTTRQRDAQEDLSIDGATIRRAWQGAFPTYPRILAEARHLQGVMPSARG